MRRFISSILAILVLVLSCFPCSDVGAMPSNVKTVEVIKAANSDNCGGGHSADICSPFCTCSCCAGFTIPVFKAIELRPLLPYTERVFVSYLPEPISEMALPIWQPPKLV